MPGDAEAILRSLKTTDAVRADAWDAVYGAKDDADLTARLKKLPLTNDVRAQLWETRFGDAAATAQPAPSADPTWAQRLGADGIVAAPVDFAEGVASSAARTVFGGGDLLKRGWNAVVPESLEMERVIDTPDVQRAMRAPDSIAGRAGSTAADIAQFFLPMGAPGKFAKAAEVAKSVALTAAATGSPVASGTAGVLSAVLPGGGAARAVGKGLENTGEAMVRSAMKPTVASLRRIAGASGEGLDAKANALVRFVIDHKLTTPEKARALFQQTEHELQRVLTMRNAPTDAATRAMRYLQSLERSAARQGLASEDVALLRKAADDLIAGPMGEVVDTVGTRALREAVPAEEALASARASSRWTTRKAWGEQKGATTEAAKAVERAQRDAVKAAVPESRALLATEGKALQSADALDRMAQRASNRDPVSLPAHVLAAGSQPVLAFASNWLRNNGMKAGMWADALGKAIQRGNIPLAADILKRVGVSIPAEIANPVPTGR